MPSYKPTVRACFVGYGVQAIINNFAPLLFTTFLSQFHMSLSKISLLVTFNFGVQLLVDLAASVFADKFGYRRCMVLAHTCCAVGLVGLTAFPLLLPDPFYGLLLSVMIYAIGGGLLEVLVTPIVENCPGDNKAGAISMLHSAYCWGSVAVVLLSTLFFAAFGTAHWRILAVIWALVPVGNAIAFALVPMPERPEETKGTSIGALFKAKIFLTVLLLMFCSGAAELAVSQWASAFTESSLGVSKTMGDLLGTMMFSILMGASRVYFGKKSDKIPLQKFMVLSALLCVGSYLLISLTKIPALGLLGCALCGLSVGIFWPGTTALAAEHIHGGTAMFAFMALAGDLGCAGGPTFVGTLSDRFGDLHMGILLAVCFPVLLLLGLFGFRKLTAK